MVELPAEITLLENLRYINLSGNKLESLPEDIFEMNSLEFLNIERSGLDIDPWLLKLIQSDRRENIRFNF